MSEKTKKVGLIGWPVKHSLSPAMHNAAFEALGMDEWNYELLPTPPDELEARVMTLKEQGYIGANVTVPHKQAIMSYLNSTVVSARGVGAVNTLIIERERGRTIAIGHNTDVFGIRADLEAHGIQLHGIKALILGAGGAAHAAVMGLANAGAAVTVVNRHSQRAWQLFRTVRKGLAGQMNITVQEMSALGQIAPDMQLIINCTSVGMWPDVDVSPWPEEIAIPQNCSVYDMVYRPQQTRFMKQASDAGISAIGGLGMLIQQGSAAFQLWTGQEPPLDAMRQAAENALQNAG